ncbi:hypothetical protein GCM10010129_37790 [Streptomyces fumigatiscleroticus]|nr:hypothetical protein GCM10010129_37790 [Streptomyces fumigatiscleroticus]
MSTAAYEVLAASHDVFNVAGAFIGGLVVAGALVWAVRVGLRVLDQESDRPRPEEQPRLPVTGPVHEIREMREPDEVPAAADGSPRLMPYELRHAGSRRGKDQQRLRWLPGKSGGFGSGGLGNV